MSESTDTPARDEGEQTNQRTSPDVRSLYSRGRGGPLGGNEARGGGLTSPSPVPPCTEIHPPRDGSPACESDAPQTSGLVPAAAPRPRIAAVYARTNTEVPPVQARIDRATDTAIRLGYEVPEALRCGDGVVYGIATRFPLWDHLVESIKRHEERVDALFVERLTDLGRDLQGNSRRLAEVSALGLVLYVDGVEWDARCAEGLAGMITEALGQQETELRSACARAAWRRRRAPVPLGYARSHDHPKRLVPAQDGSVTIVRTMFEDYASGHSLRQVAQRANACDVRHGRRPWSAKRVRRVLAHPGYSGSGEEAGPEIVDPVAADLVRVRLEHGGRAGRTRT